MSRKAVTVMLGVSLAAVLAVSYGLYSNLSPGRGAVSSKPAPSAVSGFPSSAESSETAADLAPDFTVYTDSGKAVKLSDFRGKPVVLNFWASWCGYCKQEMPEFDEVYKKQKDNIQFLFVDWTDGSGETQSTGAAYLKSAGYSFPAYYDLKQDAVAKFGLTAIPATFYIDRQGRLVDGGIGITTKDALEKGIARIK